MAPAKVRATDILTVWNEKIFKACRLRRMGTTKFRLLEHVRIIKKNMTFSKGGEQNYTTEIFKINKDERRSLRPV
jgi:hypothetical protein